MRQCLWMAVVVAALAACTQEAQPRPAAPRRPALPEYGGHLRPETLVIGVTPFASQAELRAYYAPLAEYLGRELGMPTRLVVPASYRALSAAIARGEVHVGILAPFNYVGARQEHPKLVLLATALADGLSSYAGYIIARADSPIATLADLAGKRFAFVDERSTSGYLYPLAFLRRAGYDPKTLFAKTTFAGNHSRLVEQVLAGEVDAGATYAIAFRHERAKELKIVAKTGRIPLDAYAAYGELDRELVRALRQKLLALSSRTPEGHRVLSSSYVNGFVEANDAAYDELRELARFLGDETGPEEALAK